MKIVIQRVSSANVTVEEQIIGKIEKGFVILLGISNDDTEEIVVQMARKVCNLRIFSDENDKMNLSIKDISGKILVISQFTLYADCKKGNRPSFTNAGAPEYANRLYEFFIKQIKEQGIEVEHGEFGANMKVNLTNDGPVTILLET
ncbi:MAG: D-tyrosyl-tRNA(Tyr) deacylase [Clostridia bacterium]|nr:D-tyrosyl-tRNA(Tyr) deacylase [Clostridia bacterium]